METAITVILAGTLTAVLGGLIRYREATSLIAGFDEEKITDEEGLSKLIGTNTLYVAGLTVLTGILELSGLDGKVFWTIYTVLVIALASRMLIGSRSYR